MYGAFEYSETNPIETEMDYPYHAQNGGYWKCEADKAKGKVSASSYDFVKYHTAFDMKAALVDGPISTAINGFPQAFQFYKSGIIKENCASDNPNHGIAAVGYGVEGDTEYIILKNTWGSNWGENGYVRVANVDGNGMCGINSQAVYPIFN